MGNLQVRCCDGGFAEVAGCVESLSRGPGDRAARPLGNQVLDSGGPRTLPIREHLTSITDTGSNAAVLGGP